MGFRGLRRFVHGGHGELLKFLVSTVNTEAARLNCLNTFLSAEGAEGHGELLNIFFHGGRGGVFRTF